MKSYCGILVLSVSLVVAVMLLIVKLYVSIFESDMIKELSIYSIFFKLQNVTTVLIYSKKDFVREKKIRNRKKERSAFY